MYNPTTISLRIHSKTNRFLVDAPRKKQTVRQLSLLLLLVCPSRDMFQSEAFCSDRGLGKVALAAFGLGVFMASHVCVLLYASFVALGDPLLDTTAVSRWRCLEQWSFYALALGFFHLMEFLLTAAYRPTIVSYECMCGFDTATCS